MKDASILSGNRTPISFCLSWLAVGIVTMLPGSPPCQAASGEVAVPRVYEFVEGWNGSSVLRSSIRLQEVYGSSLFASGPISIREIRFRPSAAYGQAFSASIADIQINLSTTTADPERLNRSFAANTGTDDTMVFRGSLELASAFAGPAGGPKTFDIVIPLTTPFAYDPAAGNLLIDYRNFSGSAVTYVDAGGSSTDQASRAFALDPNATAATTVDCGAEVIQIVYAEEPAAPRILSQPRDLTVLAGSSATFGVSAAGTPPLAYQWQWNGDALAGATRANLALDAVRPEQAGLYAVVVSNASGSATSAPAILTVVTNGPDPMVTVPKAYEHVDGMNGSGLLVHIIRLQEVYGASLFPPGPIAIREIRFRPSANYGRAFNVTIGDIQINLSTTKAKPENLNGQFAVNVGTDDTMVFRGSLALSSGFSGPVEGPKLFDIIIPLSTPFLFDPAAGNLLIDYRNFSGSGATFIDAGGSTQDQASRAFALNPNASVATTVDCGAEVLQLVYTEEPTAPRILAQPRDLTVLAGGAATFEVVASGTRPLAYQWRFNGDLIAGATNAALTIDQVAPGQVGAYSVEVVNSLGSIVSADAVLTVATNQPSGAVVVPNASEQVDGRNGSGLLNHVIRLQEVYGASLFPSQPITIREIRFRPSAVFGGAFQATIADLQINVSTTTANPESLSSTFASNVGSDDQVVFRGSIALSSAFQGPAAGPKAFDIVVPLTAPFVYNPAAGNLLIDYRNFSGSSVTFIDASGSGSDQASRAFAVNPNATTATTVDVGAEVLQIVYSAEETPPSIVTQPSDASIVEGASAAFGVVAVGAVPLEYQWQFNGNPVAGATNAMLTLSHVRADQAGTYSVVVSNALGVVNSAPAILTVLTNGINPILVVPSVFERVDANNGSGVLNNAIRLQEVYGASLFPPHPITIREIRFRPSAVYGRAFHETIADIQVNLSTTTARPEQLSAILANNVGPDDTTVFRGALELSSSFSGPAQGPMVFDMVVPFTTPFLFDPAAGNLLIEFRNYSGSVVTFVDAGATAGDQASRAFALGANATVATTLDGGADVLQIVYSDEPLPPSILLQPQSLHVAAGSVATFKVVAGGSRPLSYAWQFNDTELAGQTNAELALTNVHPDQAGGYSVVVTNAMGSVTSAIATLVVDSGEIPAAIVSITPAQTVEAGATVVLNVAASGTEPLSYQWSFNGAFLDGATSNRLVLEGVQEAQAGTYSVTVSNAFGPTVTASTVLNLRSAVGGAVSFMNAGGTNWAYVYDEDGVTKLEGPAYLAQLYGGPTPNDLAAVGAAVPFLTGPAAGLFMGGTRTIPTVAAGAAASVQVRVWESASGTTYEDALAAGGKVGWSDVLQIVTGGGGIPPMPPARLTGLESFSITHGVPEAPLVIQAGNLMNPPSLLDAGWTEASGQTARSMSSPNNQKGGVAAMAGGPIQAGQFQFKFRGEPGADYVVEVSTNLTDWAPLVNLLNTSGSTVVVDPDAGRFAHRFYRARLLR